jgi:rod shape-determining protein MreC
MAIGRWWNRNRKPLLIVVLFLLPFASLLFTRIQMPRLNLYEKIHAFFVHPVSEGATNAVDGIGVLWSRYLSLVGTSRENEVLRKENADLKQKILSFEETERENERLKKLLSIPSLESFDGVAGRIIGQDAAFESLGFYLNLGSEQGVRERMPVVTADGVVGTILRVYRHSSVFLALLDPAHDLDGVVVRSRARLIVEGKGKPLLARLKYLDRSEDVRVGDEVLTSGLDGVFPKGLRIGFVVKVDRPRAGVTQDAELRPAVDLGRLEEVVVLRRPAGKGEAEEKAR